MDRSLGTLLRALQSGSDQQDVTRYIAFELIQEIAANIPGFWFPRLLF